MLGNKHITPSLSSSIIRNLQKQENMTLKQIGQLMNLSESFMSYVRNGTRSLTMARLRMLEKSLKRPLPLLFLEAVDKNSIPKSLQPQYKLLQQALNKSRQLRKKLA